MSTESLIEASVRDMLISKAILMIANIKFEEDKLNSINANIQEMFGDFSPSLRIATENIQRELVDILDLILGEKLASYYLYECGGKGRIIEQDGTEWPITSTQELRQYAEHIARKYP